MLTPDLQQALHAAATLYMVGVIWLVQLVHYPMFRYLDRAAFSRSHAFHSRTIAFVVMPAMLLEVILAGLLLGRRGLTDGTALSGFGLLLLIWVITFGIMIPLHGRLHAEGFRPDLHASLLRWNWVRTISWSARGLLVTLWV